jgi:hypothetical protein
MNSVMIGFAASICRASSGSNWNPRGRRTFPRVVRRGSRRVVAARRTDRSKRSIKNLIPLKPPATFGRRQETDNHRRKTGVAAHREPPRPIESHNAASFLVLNRGIELRHSVAGLLHCRVLKPWLVALVDKLPVPPQFQTTSLYEHNSNDSKRQSSHYSPATAGVQFIGRPRRSAVAAPAIRNCRPIPGNLY